MTSYQVQASQICLSHGPRVLLDRASLTLDQDSRIALAGANGAGKSTLLKILAGQTMPDSGEVTKSRGVRIRYLAQSGVGLPRATIWEAADMAFDDLHRDARRIEEIQEALGQDPEAAAPLLDEMHRLGEYLDQHGYHHRQGSMEQVLTGLGFSPSQFGQEVSSLSGGWQMRLALAQILLASPHVMLLDEPTNYLDLDSREWLLTFIRRYQGAVVLVSHDRYVLDTAVSAVVELYQGKTKLYKGTYSTYEAQRKQELATQLAAWKKQQDEIRHLERFVERFKAKASKATQAQSRVKQLEKMDLIEVPDGLQTVHFVFPSPIPSGEQVFSLEALGRAYGTKRVLENLDLGIRRGEKVALVGRNGAGKSTLLRLLAGVDQPSAGEIRRGHQVQQAYFPQDADTHLDPALSIMEEIEKDTPMNLLPQLRNILGSFLFSDDDVFKPVSVLSGGEKSRVALVKMLLRPANLLILDEPTNHLDLHSKDVLLHALKNFSGTVVFVSHDKYFIQDLATRIVAIEPCDGGPSVVTDYPGDWAYYQWKVQGSLPAGTPAGGSPSTDKVAARSPGENEARWRDNKKTKTDIRRLEKLEEDLLEAIGALESGLAELHAHMAREEIYTQPARIQEARAKEAALEQGLADKHQQWETVSAQLEELRSALVAD